MKESFEKHTVHKEKDLEKQREGREDIIKAKEILGEDFLGSSAVERAFGIELKQEKIPKILYSREQLKKAKELGYILVLRVNKAPDGEPLTMEKMNDLLIDQIKERYKDRGEIFYLSEADPRDFSKKWYKDEEFFTRDTPRLGWKLVSKEITPITETKYGNCFKHTKRLRDYLVEHGIINKEDPAYITDEEIAKIEKLPTKQERIEAISKLPINQNYRQLPVEEIYDFLLYLQNTGKELREAYTATFTSRLSSDGERLIYIDRYSYPGHPADPRSTDDPQKTDFSSEGNVYPCW